MKIAQVRANYYFVFLRIIVLLPMLTALEKYDSHALIRNWNAGILKIQNNN